MQTAKIKRGATFKATLIFDEDEWAAIHPWDGIEADIGIWNRRHPLGIATDEDARTITLAAAPNTGGAWGDWYYLDGTVLTP